jgi:hypothetical protein
LEFLRIGSLLLILPHDYPIRRFAAAFAPQSFRQGMRGVELLYSGNHVLNQAMVSIRAFHRLKPRPEEARHVRCGFPTGF